MNQRTSPSRVATPSAPTFVTAVAVGPDEWLGRTLGKYRLTSRLGQGGMGVVYEAFDTLFRRRVAVKLLPQALSADPALLQRFLLEARSASRLKHPNIAATLDVDQREGVYFIVMELVQGFAAQELLRYRGPFPWPVAAWIAAQVCRGLTEAHTAGLIHRDIKPANILLSHDGSVKLADFGLAKVSDQTSAVTDPGNVLGTPHYMSPEQCRAEPVDDGSDLYSLGATFYALLTGKPPFPLDVSVQVMFAHCSRPAPDPRLSNTAIPEACATVVRQAMAKRRDDRYPSARAMLADLEAILPPASAANVPAHVGRLLAALTPGGNTVSAQESRIDHTTPAVPHAVPLSAKPSPRRLLRRSVLASCLAVLALSLILLALNQRGPEKEQVEDERDTAWKPIATRAEKAVQSLNRETIRAALVEVLAHHATLRGDSSAPRRLLGEVGAAVDALRCGLLFPGRDHSAGVELPTEGSVQAVACSPDLRWLAAACRDGEGGVRVWDFTSLKPCHKLWTNEKGPITGVHSIAFSPDGKTLAAGCSGGRVHFWHPDGREGKSVTMGVGVDKVTALSFSPDGKLLATLASARVPPDKWKGVRVWEWADWRERYALPPSKDAVYAIALAPTGDKVLATASADGVVRLWNQESGKWRSDLAAGYSCVANLAYASDGRTLVATGYRREENQRSVGAHQYWDVGTRSFVESRWTASDCLRSVAFSPDNELLAAGGDRVTLWTPRDRHLVASLGEPKTKIQVLALAFSPGGGMLAAGSGERFVRLWDLSAIRSPNPAR